MSDTAPGQEAGSGGGKRGVGVKRKKNSAFQFVL